MLINVIVIDFAICFTLFTSIDVLNLMQVLDPIDGTRGFLKGSEALYVVSLSNLERLL